MKNKEKTLVLIPQGKKLIEKILKYSFMGARIMEIPETFTPFEREDLAKKINKDYQNVIFYDFYNQFFLLIPMISKKVKRKWILSTSIASLSKPDLFFLFLQVLEYQDRGMIDRLASTQYDFHIALKDRVMYIQLDYEDKTKKPIQEDRIGILGTDYTEESNFYNQLSGVTISSIKKARVLNMIDATKRYPDYYPIEIEEEKDIEKLVYGNKVNLYCNMSDIFSVLFLMSMDAQIPCILGNTNILNTSPLKKYLVLDSDDDVEEISKKINQALQEKETIMKEYSVWRKKYSAAAKKSIDNFLK